MCYMVPQQQFERVQIVPGVATPKGRRGHSALIHRGSMLIYGGYQDLRGSCSELWAFHFETESWHLVSTSSSKSNLDQYPPPRHQHSAVVHNDAMWIYGGMTDLQERGDMWKWDINSRLWTSIKTKINPGALHSHAACKMPSSMLVFGGERSGQKINELWKFNFGTEFWEKITITGVKPQPRSESIAFVVSQLQLEGSSVQSVESKASRIRRTCNSADRGSRHSSYLPHNRVAPIEQTYIFQATENNYNDGSDLAQQYSEVKGPKSFLQEISKLSQMNISRMGQKCSYTVLTGCPTDSTESLLRQHSSPQGVENDVGVDSDVSTPPTRGTMVKSKSAYVIKKKYQLDKSPTSSEESCKELSTKKRVEFDSTIKKIPREPISVPNFTILTLPTPVLTPVEAAKLVYLDTDDENDFETDLKNSENITQVKCSNGDYENFKQIQRGDSYSSHLGYADNPLYQHMLNNSSVKFSSNVPERSNENVSSTSDYASIETVNRLSSSSNYSVKTNNTQDENFKNKERDKTGPFGFCNPNYMGPDIKSILSGEKVVEKKTVSRVFSLEEKTSDNYKSSTEDMLELQSTNGVINRSTKVFYRHSSRATCPPNSLALEKNIKRPVTPETRYRAISASRAERVRSENTRKESSLMADGSLPLYVYVIGGKEQGQVTVFQRPISIWKLKLF